MCGIVGYIGDNNIKEILLDGLKELEYRGYDSAGIAILHNDHFTSERAVGKLENLVHKCQELDINGFSIGIGHTRWATHGKPTETNAHPHHGKQSHVVHNGIIENYQEIKNTLLESGVEFCSQTDTEVIVHLFEYNLKNSDTAIQAFEKTIHTLKGAYAILIITQREPDKIFFAKQGSPLIVGKGKGGVYFASSDTPLIGLASKVCYLNDGEYGVATPDNIQLFTDCACIQSKFTPLSITRQNAQKEGYRYFMEKEIYEQSQVLMDCMMGRATEQGIVFEELKDGFFDGINEIRICACGTSYHAALAGSYLFERLARIRCRVEIASEFRYKEPMLTQDELFIVISQSGETADTLEALKMAKRAGLKTLSLCNIDNSSIVRESDATILTRAGIEKGVASTKAFATQMMVLWMLSLHIAHNKKLLDSATVTNEVSVLKAAADATKVSDNLHEKLKRLSKRYLHGHGFFFIGRDIFFPLALEGALKLKEISYLHAEGYPAGEMKHGPIALADSELFTVSLMPKNLHYEKMKSNVEELSARDATIVALTPEEYDIADDLIRTSPHSHYMVEFFEMMVILQILALEISIRLGNDVDMPRNLAKSVTVE